MPWAIPTGQALFATQTKPNDEAVCLGPSGYDPYCNIYI